MKRTYQVKEVAQLAGVSVRTLHHYDEIGLLVPTERTAAGYRQYDDDDLLRLQQILIGRELGLSLEDIRRSLDDPRFDRREALRAQREQLAARAHRTAEMIRAVDKALAVLDGGGPQEYAMSNAEKKELFDGFDPAQYEDEARERWGDTEAYKVSKNRTSRYTKADWERLSVEQAAIYGDMVAAMRAGVTADSTQAMDVAERHRLSIDRWFYPCSAQMHRGLADMYEADARFAENIDKHGAGLTPYLAAAIRANAARLGA
jgi:MerR family transcriptional regulator, thiopeptide resistance regulator